MTTVKLYRGKGELDFSAQGHCLASSGGTDTVCAAVSMLACTFMERLEAMRVSMKELHIGYESGSVSIYAKAKNDETARSMSECAETVMCGFRMLAAAFPKNVRVIERETDEGGV